VDCNSSGLEFGPGTEVTKAQIPKRLNCGFYGTSHVKENISSCFDLACWLSQS